ncbi:hypothetical protein DFH07DRAFT_868781 [Mycena maculata]|uniref:RING-type domain-containing protein n=1 Tax=Mycena maculata TaxID=230809 RepID=A0AAD7IXS1_9AGAR|nr:hypothetical protein DFH07DRAFT_868781 [Mycena maculata]
MNTDKYYLTHFKSNKPNHARRGKKRPREDPEPAESPFPASGSSRSSPLSSMSPAPDPDPGPVKKYKKRAETRECPVCAEQIPIRLLAAHAELEDERVQAIIRRVGETDVDFELLDSLESLAETPTRPRLTALRARKSLGTVSGSMGVNVAAALLNETSQTIQAIKRHRKQRHLKLKELVRDDEVGSSSRVRETWRSRRTAGGEIVCPVCLATVRGDEDVIEAHVDACLADQTRRLEEAQQAAIADQRRRREEDQDMGDLGGMLGPGHVGNVRGLKHTHSVAGTGFATRDPNSLDVDDEIDIDGDDEAVFGEAQFTEGDIVDALPPPQHIRPSDEDMDVDVDIGGDEETLRELVAQGKVVKREKSEPQVKDATVDEADKLDLAILSAKNRGDQASLLDLLQSKVKILESRSSATSLCRICIESYTDPTVSTGCWHTCCKECWLRCLGSTKLCPICKRITAATDLRRVYL